MTPAEVDIVLAYAAAALPQVARQLGDILAQAKEDHVLEPRQSLDCSDVWLLASTPGFSDGHRVGHADRTSAAYQAP